MDATLFFDLNDLLTGSLGFTRIDSTPVSEPLLYRLGLPNGVKGLVAELDGLRGTLIFRLEGAAAWNQPLAGWGYFGADGELDRETYAIARGFVWTFISNGGKP